MYHWSPTSSLDLLLGMRYDIPSLTSLNSLIVVLRYTPIRWQSILLYLKPNLRISYAKILGHSLWSIDRYNASTYNNPITNFLILLVSSLVGYLNLGQNLLHWLGYWSTMGYFLPILLHLIFVSAVRKSTSVLFLEKPSYRAKSRLSDRKISHLHLIPTLQKS